MGRPTQTWRILTANLFADRLNVDGFRALLKDLDPDVVVVQELSHRAAEVLDEFLPHGLLVPDDGYDGRGLALRAPAHCEVLPMAFRDGLIARLERPEWAGSLEVINVHLANPIMWRPWQSVRSRRQQLDALLRYITPPRPRLVAGDFNASPVWPVYRRLAARLEDAADLVAKARGKRPVRTWSPIPGGPSLLRIDHVFTEGLHPLDAQVVPIPGSDHRGLLVEVEPD
jgi:endonuclease/exonuclease/phosphatase (EEP) superfamily protein YafD